MARLPQVNPDTVPADQRKLVDQIKRERGGRVSSLYQILLNSPPVAAGWLHMGTAVRNESALNGAIRELVICRVAQVTGAEYEWQAHSPIAVKEGVTQEQLDELERWGESTLFSPQQQAALAYADQVTTVLDADDDTFEAVRKHFNERQTLELTVTAAFYNMVSRVLRTLQVH